jgi:hypothetical protein
MCVVGYTLVNLFNVAVEDLSAALSGEQSLDAMSARLVKRHERAAQDAIRAHVDLEEHRSRCSHCGGPRLVPRLSGTSGE